MYDMINIQIIYNIISIYNIVIIYIYIYIMGCKELKPLNPKGNQS